MTDTTDAPTLPDLLTQAMIQKAITDALKEAADAHRVTTFEQMLAAKKTLNVKTFDVAIGGENHAKATITEPSDKRIISDDDAFMDWVQDNYASEVEVKVAVRDAWFKSWLKGLEVTEAGLVDPNNGEIVPGLKYLPKGEATSFSITFNKKDVSKVAVLRAALPPEALAMFGIDPIYGELGEEPEAEPVVVSGEAVEPEGDAA